MLRCVTAIMVTLILFHVLGDSSKIRCSVRG